MASNATPRYPTVKSKFVRMTPMVNRRTGRRIPFYRSGVTHPRQYPVPSHYRAYADPAGWRNRAMRKRAARIATRYAMTPAYALGLAADIGVGNYLTRGQRQKTFLGNGNMLVNYRSRMPPAKKKATNRKNVNNMKRKTVKSNKQVLQKQINQLAKKVNISLSKHTHRYAAAGRVVANDGECDHVEVAPITPTLIEGYTDNLRFFDSSSNALETKDTTFIVQSHDVKFKNIHSKLTIKNNYSTPLHLKVYLCKVKGDNAAGVVAEYTNALTDTCVTAGADTETALMYLTDVERLRENWNIDCVIDKRLIHGAVASTSHGTGEFNYDPSHADYEADAYQSRYKSFLWVIRIQGEISHDSTNPATEIGIGDVACDYFVENKAEIVYNAGGVQLNDYSFNEQRTTSFTADSLTGVINSPDNIVATGA